jgi:hypothetical protein
MIQHLLNEIKEPLRSSVFTKKLDGSPRFQNPKNFGGQEYGLNYLGYRNDFEFDEVKFEKVNLFFGCSHTFGVGLEQGDIYFNHIPKEDGVINVNMGIPGAGIQEVSYCIAGSLNKFYNINKIYMFVPHIGTRPYSFEYNRSFNLGYLMEQYSNEDIVAMMSPKHQKEYDLFLIKQWEDYLPNSIISIEHFSKEESVDFAKDGQHYGPLTHKNLSKRFYDR